jgi:hypothetical protein
MGTNLVAPEIKTKGTITLDAAGETWLTNGMLKAKESIKTTGLHQKLTIGNAQGACPNLLPVKLLKCQGVVLIC